MLPASDQLCGYSSYRVKLKEFTLRGIVVVLSCCIAALLHTCVRIVVSCVRISVCSSVCVVVHKCVCVFQYFYNYVLECLNYWEFVQVCCVLACLCLNICVCPRICVHVNV